MSIAAHHAEWLSLVDVSGPFLSVGVLTEALPNGLDAHDPDIAAELRAAHDAWSDPEASDYADTEKSRLHGAFIRFVLHRVLGFEDRDIKWEGETLDRYAVPNKLQGSTLRPDAVVMDGDKALMLITAWDPSVPIDQPIPGDSWTASPRERMAEHLRETEVPLGLVTDGERWTCVSRKGGNVPGYSSWWASLWREERITLQAFRTLLGEHRFFSLPEDETLPGLLERSAQDQSEITTKLGNQTLEAVEILIRTIDRLDRDRGGQLLAEVEESELYDAAVTVMMRLIFLFFAEENDLLPMNEPLYVQEYAASSLRARLQEAADQSGEEVLETTNDAWPRLLATWRAVFAGVEHGDMRLAPYGGSLFDPDRYAFLEGRLPGSSWLDEGANPLPIDNRTVLHLLNALQTLHERGQRRRLSFRALDVEQIGHVYEGMLDHTAERAKGWVLGLSGTGGKEPEIPLREMEGLDDGDLIDLLKDRTGRNAGTVRNWLAADPNTEVNRRFPHSWSLAFGGDPDAARRVRRFARFIREDSAGGPTVFQPGSVYVCDSSHRGATGTHYTPQELTEEVVKGTLDPLVYDGPNRGLPREEWRLRRSEEILALKVCDPACGSGAFLVQACRYLSERLVEARFIEKDLRTAPEDISKARREVVEHCLYGVDVNPMAVTMAKLSLWLITLSKDRPFTFLDHALRCGDSLIGVTSLDQISSFHIDPKRGRHLHQDSLFDITPWIKAQVEHASLVRKRIAERPSLDITDVNKKHDLLSAEASSLGLLRRLSDLVVLGHLFSDGPASYEEKVSGMALSILNRLGGGGQSGDTRQISEDLDGGLHNLLTANPENPPVPFHWPLEFVEVFQSDREGFDGILGNPPFMGGGDIARIKGIPYERHLKALVPESIGFVDLAAYFHRRAVEIVSPDGLITLLGPQTLPTTANRAASIAPIVERTRTIVWARNNVPWPGRASVDICAVCYAPGKSRINPILDRKPVKRISASLTSGHDVASARRLRPWLEYSNGIHFYGGAFIKTADEWGRFLRAEPALRRYLRRFVNAEILCNEPNSVSNLYAVDFGERDRHDLMDVKEVVDHLVHRVGQERAAQTRQIHESRQWLHWDKRTATFAKARELERVLIVPILSKHLPIVPMDPACCFSKALTLVVSDSWGLFGLMQSIHFISWVFSTSPWRGTRVSFSTRNSLDTFVPPSDLRPLAGVGQELYELRRESGDLAQVGVTEVINRVNDPSEEHELTSALRDCQRRLDAAVSAAYQWSDLPFDHGFHDTPTGTRYTLHPDQIEEVKGRLLRLNFQAFVEEVEQGIHGRVPVPRIVETPDGSVRLADGRVGS